METQNQAPELPHNSYSLAGTVAFAFISVGLGSLWLWSGRPLDLSLILFINLAALSWFDWHFFRLPNLLTAVLALASAPLLLNAPAIVIEHHIIGGVVGLLTLPIINWFYMKLRGRHGIGMGDAKLLGGIGLWLGWTLLPIVLLTSSVAALVYASLLIVRTDQQKRKQVVKKPLPFGVFLSFGTWMTWLFA